MLLRDLGGVIVIEIADDGRGIDPEALRRKAIALGEPEGFIKTVFDAKTGELLGAHMIGAEVTSFTYGHFNSFPLIRTDTPNGGAFDHAGGEDGVPVHARRPGRGRTAPPGWAVQSLTLWCWNSSCPTAPCSSG